MKDLKELILEGLVLEAAAKNVHQPRKGSTLYILKQDETKAVPVKVASCTKHKDSWYSGSDGYDIIIDLEENPFNFEGWTEAHYGKGFDYSDEKHQVKTIATSDGLLYIGTTKEKIQEYVRLEVDKKLNGVLSSIKKKQEELDELLQKKQKLEEELNIEITESLK